MVRGELCTVSREQILWGLGSHGKGCVGMCALSKAVVDIYITSSFSYPFVFFIPSAGPLSQQSL